MARPKKSHTALDKVVSVRIDSATHAKCAALAKASGFTLGEWARTTLQDNHKALPVGCPPPPPVNLKLLAEVCRCGVIEIIRPAVPSCWYGPPDTLATVCVALGGPYRL